MGAWRTISVALTANTTGYSAGLRATGAQTSRWGRQVERDVGRAGGAWAKLGTFAKGAGLAVALALISATGAAIGFEARMRNVNSIALENEAGFRRMSAQVLDLSKRFPQSANNLAEGLYDITSSGFKGAEALHVLEYSAKAASAGLTTTENSAKAVAAVINAYGLEAYDAEAVSNTLFQTVNVGVVSFEQLTGVIGDVVGTAAAATVSIDEVGGAIATMTLSGISADEAGTSLNRMLQSLIDPSDSLAQAFRDVGYESGAQALQTDELNVVMGKLLELADGNIETLLRWFPEIRAARGALALAAGDGRNYAEAQEAVNRAQEGGGALQKAYAEQLKSTRAQIQLLSNQVQVAAIALGTTFLPYIRDAIKELRDLGNRVLPFVRDRWEELQEAGENLREILGEVVDFAGDAAEGLGEMGAGAVMAGIVALTSGLAEVTGFLAEHPALIRAITVALIGMAAVKTWSLLVSGAETFYLKSLYALDVWKGSGLRLALQNVGLLGGGIRMLGTDAQVAGTQIKSSLGGIFRGLAPTLGVAAIGLAVYGVGEAYSNAGSEAREFREQVEAQVDLTSVQSVRRAVQQLEELQERHRVTAGGFLQNFARTIFGPTAAWDLLVRRRVATWDYLKNGMEASGASEELQEEGRAAQELLRAHSRELGIGIPKLMEYAEAAGVVNEELLTEEGWLKTKAHVVDLRAKHAQGAKAAQQAGLSYKEALELPEEELQKIVEAQEEMDAFVDSMGLLGPTVIAQAGQSGDAFKEMAKDAQKFIESVGEAFSGYGNIVAGFGDDVEVTGGEIEKWYSSHLAGAAGFSEDIRKAIQQGYDPNLISRLLQAGPEQAGPLLDQLVSGHSQTFIDMVNNSEKALADISQQAVEMARLTHIAMTSEFDTAGKDLSRAMEISQAIAASGGSATAGALAFALGLGVEEVERIAEEYGITLAKGINPVLAGVGARQVNLGRVTRGEAVAAAEGGFLDPARFGDTRRDSINARLMPGEYVVRRDAVNQLGLRRLEEINRGRLPGFAAGGFFSPADVPRPPDVSHRGNQVGYAGGATMNHAYAQVVDYLKKSALSGPAGSAPSGAIQQMAQAMLAARGWGAYWGALQTLVSHESGWRNTAQNPTSTAYGLFQFLDSTWASVGGSKTSDPRLQLQYGLDYIAQRYGTPAGAWKFWQQHHWYGGGGLVGGLPFGSYDRGGHLPPGLSLAYNGTGRPEPVGHFQPSMTVNVYVGGEKLDSRIDYRVEMGQERMDLELRKR